MREKTIVYYTHNRERPEFERKVKDEIERNCGDIPVISVSQLPMDFGKNICVGDRGISGNNAYRQLLIGAKAAETDFIIMTESDTLYPPEYFKFQPERDDVFYVASPVYMACILPVPEYLKPGFIPHPERHREGQSIVGRDFLIRSLESTLEPFRVARNAEWRGHTETRGRNPDLFGNRVVEAFEMSQPVVTFKTDRNMHNHRFLMPRRYKTDVFSIPYWGDYEELVGRFGA